MAEMFAVDVNGGYAEGLEGDFRFRKEKTAAEIALGEVLDRGSKKASVIRRSDGKTTIEIERTVAVDG